MKTLIIDNYDSFTYNLYQMIAEINEEIPVVIKNDECDFEDLCLQNFDNLIISPGPGHPDNKEDFGICKRVLLEVDIPILGVCLGHQGIFSGYGGQVVCSLEAVHGRISRVIHNGDSLFNFVPKEFNVVRYHSLICKNEIPDCLKVIAWTEDKTIMAIKHKQKPIWGVQFHPESICSEYGDLILNNFNHLTRQYYNKE